MINHIKSKKTSLTIALRLQIMLGVMIMFMAFLPSVSAWSNDTFNNSLSEEFLSFINPGSFVRYLQVPSGIRLTHGSINLTYPAGLSSLANNLKLYYDMTNNTELVSGDYNLSNNQGIMIYNATNCKIGNCSQIAGNRNLRIPTNPYMNFTGNASINFWIRPVNNTAPASDEYVFFSPQNNSGRMSIDESSRWTWNSWFANGVNNKTNGTEPQANQFFMITVTVQNDTKTNYTIYVNGVIENSSNVGAVGIQQPIQFLLGTNFNNASDFNGTMDEFGVWNVTLTPAEVSQLYNSGSGLGYSSLGGGDINLLIGGTNIQSVGVSNDSSATNASGIVSGLHSTINSYLNTCSYVGGICDVPFNFSSNIASVWMLYNRLNFSNTDFLENSQTFQTPVQELSSISFSINITLDSNYYTSSSAVLVYNNTRFSGTKTGTANDFLFSRTITAPSVGASTPISFYWEFTLNNGSTTTLINSTSNSQTVTNLGIDDCSSNTVMILNYTIYDEDSRIKIPSALNTSFEITVSIGDQNLDNYLSLSFNRSNVNPVLVCMQNLNSTLRLDSTIKYSSDLRVIEYHNIQNHTLTNQSIPINVSLYDLLITSSQEYLITYKDANFIPAPNVLIDITRQYLPLGQFLTVEVPKTDESGKTIGHFVSNDVVYTIYVRKDGQLLASFQNVQLFCASAVGDCRLNLNAQGSTSSPSSFLNKDNLSYSNSYNSSTRTYSFDFIALDGIERLISLNITSSSSGLTLCSNYVTSSSGTLTCTIPSNINGTAITKIYVNNNLFLSDTFSIVIFNGNILPSFRYLIAGILVLTLPLIAISSPVATLVLFIIGLIFATAMVAIDAGGWFGATAAALWLVIATVVVLVIKDRRDQNG